MYNFICQLNIGAVKLMLKIFQEGLLMLKDYMYLYFYT